MILVEDGAHQKLEDFNEANTNSCTVDIIFCVVFLFSYVVYEYFYIVLLLLLVCLNWSKKADYMILLAIIVVYFQDFLKNYSQFITFVKKHPKLFCL